MASAEAPTHRASRLNLRLILGIVLILAGLWVAWRGFPGLSRRGVTFHKVQELLAGDPVFTQLSGHYPANAIERYEVSQGTEASLTLDVAKYRSKDGGPRRVIVYLDSGLGAPSLKKLRHDLWMETVAAIGRHTDDTALFLSWWDNAQRIDFFTGRQIWATTPTAAAFANSQESALWEQVAGPFEADDARLRQLARWLAMDAGQALAEMAKTLPAGGPAYLLACLDDLARVSEVERLSGKTLGFEASLFPSSGDIHAQIAGVKRWASEKGNGSYLVQQIPGQGVRAWRVTDAATENSLFAKMLPFTSSLAAPVAGLDTVNQSSWGGYLTIYQLNR